LKTDNVFPQKLEGISFDKDALVFWISDGGFTLDNMDCKPYLFPLSSMNEVQKNIYSIYINELKQSNGIYFEKALNSLQFWLYANHFDVNNLIPMGLAINAVGLNIY
jgi:hypothetical protein